MKKAAKKIIVIILGWQVRRLRKKTNVKVVAVAGSIGKTSTKYAVATVLEQSYRVCWQEGNYNDLASVPLVFFGLDMPSLFNPIAWLMVFIKIERKLAKEYPYDVVVIELGTDYPGNLVQFKKFIHADIGVLTAIAPEHMEFFMDLDTVAKEELTIAGLSNKLLIGIDYCDQKYLAGIDDYLTYGESQESNYRLNDVRFSLNGSKFRILKEGKEYIDDQHDSFAKTQLMSVTAAVAVADFMGIDKQSIKNGIHKIMPVSGRMQRLQGINDSIILDDTYNSSPEAVKAALDTLYKIDAPQKITLLGNMNELGSYSDSAHIEIGKYCDPKQVNLVVTLGPDANNYTALAAEENGCKVVRTDTPYQAAEVIKDNLKNGAVILVKGSQNMVFAEEAVKALLDNPDDTGKLVRQSPSWLQKKQRIFSVEKT